MRSARKPGFASGSDRWSGRGCQPDSSEAMPSAPCSCHGRGACAGFAARWQPRPEEGRASQWDHPAAAAA
eukprot:11184014-Lingulodinium_polyedra.AAC.1